MHMYKFFFFFAYFNRNSAGRDFFLHLIIFFLGGGGGGVVIFMLYQRIRHIMEPTWCRGLTIYLVYQVRSLDSPVCQMRLKAVAPSPYDLDCWWDVKHKTQDAFWVYSINSLSY